MSHSAENKTDPDDLGFSFTCNKSGDLFILRAGRQVTILRGTRASQAALQLEDLAFRDQQILLTKLSGNYKRGNEKPPLNCHSFFAQAVLSYLKSTLSQAAYEAFICTDS